MFETAAFWQEKKAEMSSDGSVVPCEVDCEGGSEHVQFEGCYQQIVATWEVDQ